MSTEFTREDRYIVFKLSDVERYLIDADRVYFAMMKNEIDAGRDCANKPPFKGLIVESDWPEYEPTWNAIEARVIGAQPAPSVPDGFSREDLEAVADGLDGYEKTVNVGNVTGEGDDHLESTTAYAARFIRAMLAAAPEAKP